MMQQLITTRSVNAVGRDRKDVRKNGRIYRGSLTPVRSQSHTVDLLPVNACHSLLLSLINIHV